MVAQKCCPLAGLQKTVTAWVTAKNAKCSDCNCGDSCTCGPTQKCNPKCSFGNPVAGQQQGTWNNLVAGNAACPVFAQSGPFKAMVVVTQQGEGQAADANCCPQQAALRFQFVPGLQAGSPCTPPVAQFQPSRCATPAPPQTYAFANSFPPVPLPPPPSFHPPVSPQAPSHESELMEHLAELTAENALLKTQAEAREEILSQRLMFLEELAEAKVENAQLEARLEMLSESRQMMEEIVEVLVDKARLEGKMEAVEQRAALAVELAEVKSRTATSFAPPTTAYVPSGAYQPATTYHPPAANGGTPRFETDAPSATVAQMHYLPNESQMLKHRIAQLEAQLKALDASGNHEALPTPHTLRGGVR